MATEKKKTRGRQKVEMVKMANENNLQVTFSKRRSGLFNKASELSTLCGAEIAVIVFSPGKKVFSFGHPSVESVINRYISGNQQPRPSRTMQIVEAHRNSHIRDLNMEFTQVMNQVEIEKKRGEELRRIRKVGREQFWWQKPIDELDLAELEYLKASLENLRKSVTKQTDMLLMQNSQSHPEFLGSGSNQPMLPFETNNRSMNIAHNQNQIQGFDNHGFF
ncbi:agamous-like MADS-box protein AGL62 [Euphorbia lathyris]|uniref:agamous-like MADS-box protein AGL62 n=1 Tax=Euphorbia lathyris TaxID=212925 RepID=UPI003313D60E